LKEEEHVLEVKETISEPLEQSNPDEIKEGSIVYVPSFKANGLVIQAKREDGK